MTDFGTDLSCVDDLDPYMLEVSGIDVVSQAILRRLTTTRGMLIDDPDYGLNVRDYLSATMDAKELTIMQSQLEAELLKDERILSVESTASMVLRTATIKLLVEVGEGPFSLTLAISDVSAAILSVE